MFSLLILIPITFARGPALITTPDDVIANIGDTGIVYNNHL